MIRGYQPDLGYVLAAEASPWQHYPDHWLTLVPEGIAPGDRMWANTPVLGLRDLGHWPGPDTRGEWDVPFLRPTCSCGWRSENNLWVIEENAIHHWRTEHISLLPDADSVTR